MATELHEVYGSPHARQVLAIGTALSMLYKVMGRVWGQTEAAKLSRHWDVIYDQLSQADATSRLRRTRPKLQMLQKLF